MWWWVLLACRRLWLLIAGVCYRGLNWSFGGVWCCFGGGYKFQWLWVVVGGASDGYLAMNWDLAVILKFSVIKFVWMLRKCKKLVGK